MNNTLLVTLLALMLVILLTVLAVTLLDGPGNAEALLPEVSAPAPPSGGVSEKTEYLLGVYDGKLALFIGGSSYPNKVYDVRVRSLPQADQALIESGLPVEDESELARLIEDFTS